MAYKASVIIPVYNAEKTLRRCVESLVLGTEPDVEVILVDDCSTDQSLALCMELSKEFSNVISLHNEKNMGVSFTRNLGLGKAQGEYILFVDSDDWVSGKYVEKMLKMTEKNKDRLPVCSFHFIDKVNNYRTDYVWSADSDEAEVISADRFFELADKFFLQQLWNKIFDRKLIVKNDIQFDENQSMGEDYQFVLDYLEKSGIHQCAISSEALYYYIRWNNSSLISQFGLNQKKQEYDRIIQLAGISGADKKTADQQIEKLQKNYVYHLSRNKKLSLNEKLENIEKVMQDGQSKSYYAGQVVLQMKENISLFYGTMKSVPGRFLGKIQRIRRDILIKNIRRNYHPKDISIISQNCIGGVIYHDLGCRFSSPTVNLFFKEPDFITFVNNLHHYLNCDLKMIWGEEYPLGKLDDITIYFMHYENCREAMLAWERRKKRVDYDNILVLATDHEGFGEKTYQQWVGIPYRKILFTANNAFAEDCDSVYYPKYSKEKCVPDLIPDREFYKDGKVLGAIEKMSGIIKR